ncbi:MAG: hypothetical protein ACYCY7_00255 [Gallionella sp.]
MPDNTVLRCFSGGVMGDQNFLIMLCVMKDMQEKNQPENWPADRHGLGLNLPPDLSSQRETHDPLFHP